jgi:hypothetical protein
MTLRAPGSAGVAYTKSGAKSGDDENGNHAAVPGKNGPAGPGPLAATGSAGSGEC